MTIAITTATGDEKSELEKQQRSHQQQPDMLERGEKNTRRE